MLIVFVEKLLIMEVHKQVLSHFMFWAKKIIPEKFYTDYHLEAKPSKLGIDLEINFLFHGVGTTEEILGMSRHSMILLFSITTQTFMLPKVSSPMHV